MTKGRYEPVKGHAGIFRYIGKKTVYGIDYYLDRRKHRRSSVPFLGMQQRGLEVKQGGYLPQSVKKKAGLDSIIADYKKIGERR